MRDFRFSRRDVCLRLLPGLGIAVLPGCSNQIEEESDERVDRVITAADFLPPEEIKKPITGNGLTPAVAKAEADAASSCWNYMKLGFKALAEMDNQSAFFSFKFAGVFNGEFQIELNIADKTGKLSTVDKIMQDLKKSIGAGVTVDGKLSLSGFCVQLSAGAKDAAGSRTYETSLTRAIGYMEDAKFFFRKLTRAGFIAPLSGYFDLFYIALKQLECGAPFVLVAASAIGGGSIKGKVRVLVTEINFEGVCLGYIDFSAPSRFGILPVERKVEAARKATVG